MKAAMRKQMTVKVMTPNSFHFMTFKNGMMPLVYVCDKGEYKKGVVKKDLHHHWVKTDPKKANAMMSTTWVKENSPRLEKEAKEKKKKTQKEAEKTKLKAKKAAEKELKEKKKADKAAQKEISDKVLEMMKTKDEETKEQMKVLKNYVIGLEKVVKKQKGLKIGNKKKGPKKTKK